MSTSVATTDVDTALKAAQDALSAHNFAEAKLQATVARVAALRGMKIAKTEAGGGGGFEAEQFAGRDWDGLLAQIEAVEAAIARAGTRSHLITTRTRHNR